MRIEEIFCYMAYTIYIYAVFQCATNFMICLCIILWRITLTFFLFQNDKFWILKRNSSLFLVILNNFTRVSRNNKTVALDINIIHYIYVKLSYQNSMPSFFIESNCNTYLIVIFCLFKIVCLLKQHFEISFTLNFRTIKTGNKINTSTHNYFFDHR